MKKKHKAILTLVLVVFCFSLLAQPQVEMADTLRSEGKIYVVVTIMLVIFFGLVAYLILMDRKMTQLEKQISGRDQKH